MILTLVHKLKALPPFRHPEQELETLSSFVHEQDMSQHEREILAYDLLREYQEMHEDELIDTRYRMEEEERASYLSQLQPEAHDRMMHSLMQLLFERGLKNTLGVLSCMNNPHLEDDFHRFLVRYLLSGKALPDQLRDMHKHYALQLFQIHFDEHITDDLKVLVFKKLITQVLTSKKISFCSLECALSEKGDDISYYLALSGNLAEHLVSKIQKDITGIRLEAKKDDYNIFSFSAAFSATQVHTFPEKRGNITQGRREVLKRLLLSAKSLGKGFALQYVIQPYTEHTIALYGKVLDTSRSLSSRKLTSSLYHANIRLLSSAETKQKADHMLEELKKGCLLHWGLSEDYDIFRNLNEDEQEDMLRQYVYRFFAHNDQLSLSLDEIGEIVGV